MNRFFHSIVLLSLIAACFAMPQAVLASETVANGPLRSERIKALRYIEMARDKYGVGVALYLAVFRKIEEEVKAGRPEDQIKTRIDGLNKRVYQQMVNARKMKMEAAQQPRTSSVRDGPMSNIENILISKINEERRKRGLNTLRRSIKLVSMAREHSEDMARQHYFSHKDKERGNAFTRAQRKGYNISVFENIAKVPTNARGRNRAEMAHIALMRSPGHKANILNPKFVTCGVGCKIGQHSVLLVTQLFSMDNI